MEAGALGRDYNEGEVVVHQGEIGECMYVILEGEVEVILDQGGQSVRLAVRREGEFFGEMAIFEREVRRIVETMSQRIRELSEEVARLKLE